MDRSRPPKTRKASSVKLLKTAPSPSCDAASPTRDVSGLLVGQCCSVARQWTSRDARCATHGAASRDAVATSRDALPRTMDARRRAMAIVRHRGGCPAMPRDVRRWRDDVRRAASRCRRSRRTTPCAMCGAAMVVVRHAVVGCPGDETSGRRGASGGTALATTSRGEQADAARRRASCDAPGATHDAAPCDAAGGVARRGASHDGGQASGDGRRATQRRQHGEGVPRHRRAASRRGVPRCHRPRRTTPRVLRHRVGRRAAHPVVGLPAVSHDTRAAQRSARRRGTFEDAASCDAGGASRDGGRRGMRGARPTSARRGTPGGVVGRHTSWDALACVVWRGVARWGVPRRGTCARHMMPISRHTTGGAFSRCLSVCDM